MASKLRLRGQCSKRFGNVENGYHSKLEETNFSSSESEFGVHINKNKVREEFSTKKLLKESECFSVDDDHIYSSARSSGTFHNYNRRRKVSEESDEKPIKKKCFSKNAVMARLNRERKKKYVSSLEAENESLQRENIEMSRKLEEQNKNISAMRREVLYLKGLLANSKELGQILKNLKETTGLPVTSSLISTAQKEIKTEFLEKSSILREDYQNPVEHHPRLRSVSSGSNFPILDKDINLGSCLDNTSKELADLENSHFDFENDSYDIFPENLYDENSFFNFTRPHSEFELEESFEPDDLSKKVDPQVGICLHVNQKRISVEMCSICNSKAGSFFGDLPEEEGDEEEL